MPPSGRRVWHVCGTRLRCTAPRLPWSQDMTRPEPVAGSPFRGAVGARCQRLAPFLGALELLSTAVKHAHMINGGTVRR